MDVDQRSSEEITELIRTLHAAECAVHSQLLVAIAAADDPSFYCPDGAGSMAEWLQMFLKISRRTALDWARVAATLGALPTIAEAHATGILSFDQVRAVTRYATPETDPEDAETAACTTIAGLEALARVRVPVDEARIREIGRRQSLRLTWDEDKTCLRLRGRFGAADGVTIETAILGLASRTPLNEDGTWPEPTTSYADALVELASTRLADTTFAAAPTVVVHIASDVLDGRKAGNGVFEHGQILARTGIEQVVCDCSLVGQLDNPDGTVMGIGRRSRHVPWWLRQRLTHRDGGCRWPGCGRTRWLHAHHITHWLHGGPTDEDNLLLLCGRHHHLIHDEGWTITGNAYDTEFHRPYGDPLATRSQPLRPEIRERLRQIIQPALPGTPAQPLFDAG